MASSFTQYFTHAVWAVKYRDAQISASWEAELFNIIGGGLKDLGHVPIKINGPDDHVHALWMHHKTRSVSETMKIIKGRSSSWINDNALTLERFRWQGGYGAFSVSSNRVADVKSYITRQKAHHQKENLLTEYERLLKSSGITDVQQYMFEHLANRQGPHQTGRPKTAPHYRIINPS